MSSQSILTRASGLARRLRWLTLRRVGIGILYLALTAGAILALLPFAWMISTSLKRLPEAFRWPIAWLPDKPVWQNYVTVFSYVPFLRFYGNTAFVAVARTLGVLLTSCMAGYAFARLRFPGRDAIFLIYLGTMMIPDQVTLIPRFVTMRLFHWIDTYQALIVPGLFSAFGAFLMRQFLMSIPRSLDDAAIIDGADHLGIFWRISLPLSKPAIATLIIFAFVGSWNDFLWPLVIINSVEKLVLSVGLAHFQDLYYTEWTLLMAASVMAMVPVVLIYLFAQRYFVQGIALTGVKG
jgi:multiple sugar transport system permease protein